MITKTALAPVVGEGRYRGRVDYHRLQQSSVTGSQAVAVHISMIVTEMFSNGWIPLPQHRTVTGDFWIIGRHGKVNAQVVRMLRDVLNFNGLEFVGTPSWSPPSCQCEVTAREYNRAKKHHISYVYPFNSAVAGHLTRDQMNDILNRFKDEVLTIIHENQYPPTIGKNQPSYSWPASQERAIKAADLPKEAAATIELRTENHGGSANVENETGATFDKQAAWDAFSAKLSSDMAEFSDQYWADAIHSVRPGVTDDDLDQITPEEWLEISKYNPSSSIPF